MLKYEKICILTLYTILLSNYHYIILTFWGGKGLGIDPLPKGLISLFFVNFQLVCHI